MLSKRTLALAHRPAEIQWAGNGAAQPFDAREASVASFVIEAPMTCEVCERTLYRSARLAGNGRARPARANGAPYGLS
ncbi:hypothetical protein ABIA43_006856 [Bradyrhizobium sp. USDA 328]